MPGSVADYVYFVLEVVRWKSLLRIGFELRSKYDREFSLKVIHMALQRLAKDGYVEIRQNDPSAKKSKKQKSASPSVKCLEFRRSNKHWPHLSDKNNVFFGS